MGRGKKFNSRKETIQDEDYFGIRIYRFYMFCTRCAGEFTIKTDPKNADYLTELGCYRNFEPTKAEKAVEEVLKTEQEKDEEGDAMRALENRTAASKREMDILDALDEIRSLNARAAEINVDNVIAAINAKKAEEEMLAREAVEQAEEEEIKEVFALRRIEAEEESKPKVDPAILNPRDLLTDLQLAKPTQTVSSILQPKTKSKKREKKHKKRKNSSGLVSY